MAVNISKQLHGWLESLKNSEIKGVKFLQRRNVHVSNKRKNSMISIRKWPLFERNMKTGSNGDSLIRTLYYKK